jgi:hypothetical protein
MSTLGDCTHVPHVDDLAPLGARCSEIGKRVGRDRSCGVVLEATSCSKATPAPTVASAEATTASTEATTASAEAAAAEAATATKASSATKAHAGVSEAIGTDLEDAALPIIAIELLDSVSSIVGGFEYHDTGSLGSPIGSQMDIGADDTASAGCGHCVSVPLAST